MRLKDKVSVVTGGARGIGLGCVQRFAQEGAHVVIIDVMKDAGLEAAQEIKDRGGRALFVECDVGIKKDVDNAIAAAISEFGQIDVLLSNAGINRPIDFLELSESDWDLVIQTNLKSVFLFGQGVGKHMADRGIRGSIINMCSTSAILTMPTLSAYAASKGGIAALTNAMSLSLAPRGIRVNAIGPGTIITDLTKKRLWDDVAMRESILSRTPMGRMGETSDVAGVAMFLACDDSAYVSGQVIYVEGGRIGLNYTMPKAA